ncbi:hypothetical protein PX860_09425 [Agrobacterium leguminum]|uniref:hypothetical protein n=1 Tax=Agrobacterium leguminum TaxID=2792015 RepID=UPI00272AAEFB|nr:hypothetical protein [Agrobacterium leguminum]WLD95801.1 hypothetical protein PX860_09425 [Agrobacterium leguminum]
MTGGLANSPAQKLQSSHFPKTNVDINSGPLVTPSIGSRSVDRSNGMSGFESRYEEAQRRKREAQEKRTHDNSEFNEFALAASEQKNLVRKRLEEGFEHPFEREIGGRVRQPFKEMGLRSEDNAVLKYFVTLVPKGGKARASDDKANLAVQCKSKLLTLDYPYIELNREFLSALRVDCDGVFHTPEACLFLLTEAVRYGRIPCLPHIVVGDLLDNGQFSRPHLIWMLPQGAAVWRSEDNRCRQQPIRLFDAVARGLAAALIDIGADPAAPTMTGRMKCPTSPFWFTLTPNADIWPTLTEYADYVDTGISRATLVRKAAVVQSGLGLTPSNQIFEVLRREGQRLLAEWHFNADDRMQDSKAALADHLHVALAEFAQHSCTSEEGVGYVTAKVADYLASHFDSAKLDGKAVNRGKLLDVVDGLKTVAERQAAGGRYSGKAKGVSTFEKLLAAYRQLEADGTQMTQTSLAKASGVSRRTVNNRWAEIVNSQEHNQRRCENRCIDKKEACLPAPAEYPVIAANPVDDTKSQYRAANPTRLEGDTVSDPHKWAMKASKANVSLIAGERIRRHAGALGQRQTIKPVIDDLAAVYGVTLTEAEALQAANSATDLMKAIEQICEGRWLSGDELAAMHPIAA